MKMDMFIGTVLLEVFLFTNGLCSIEKEEKSFEEADEFCKLKGQSLLSYGKELVDEVLRTNFTGYLWIGSPWYKGKDCYTADTNKTLPGGSLYNCSTWCNNFDYIGLQENRCACFNDVTEYSTIEKCNRDNKFETDTESLKFGTNDYWYMYKKDWKNYTNRNLVHVSAEKRFRITHRDKRKEKFICTTKIPQTDSLLTTTEYKDYDEKHNSVSENSYIIPTVVVSGIAALLIVFVVVVVIIKKRNHTEIARDEMVVLEHNYSSVQKDGRPIHENSTNDADVSFNKPQVNLKEDEVNADTDVYDTTGASNNTQSNISDIYDHTNSTEGVYDVTDHVNQRGNDVDNTYDHV